MKQKPSKLVAIITAILLVSLMLSACAPAAAATLTAEAVQPEQLMSDMQMSAPVKSPARLDPLVFQQAMRKLWEDHIIWTRVYIISALVGLPELDSAAGRLLQNQADLGNAIKPFYGDQAGDQLTALLEEHILTAGELLDAAKIGDNARFEAALQAWYANADQIARFLSAANPDHWPLSEMQAMMKSHLDLTLNEATARLNQDWAGDVAAYEQVHADILEMADMLAAGIIQQFSDKFIPAQASDQEVALTLAMDKLWEDHVTWTRMYIISATSDLPDADAAAQRLLQNQEDIGKAIKSFYGDQAGDQLTALLREHILIAVDLLAAAKSGDKAGFKAAQKSWYANADQIAVFLNSANPENWKFNEMRTMMRSHLSLTLKEATARLKGNWNADVAAFDKVHNQILEMSGMLAQGIIAQFPEQFE